MITIGIIGLVAALTLPNLIHNSRMKELESRFKKANAMVIQLSRYMQLNGDPVDPTYYYYRNGVDVYSVMGKYFPGATLCGKSYNHFTYFDGCYNSHNHSMKPYRNFPNKAEGTRDLIDENIYLLKDGSILFLESSRSFYITIDVNGYLKKPNRWGYDTFMWQLKNSTFVPMGYVGTDYRACSMTAFITNDANGLGCAAKAASDPNYFKNLPKE